MKKNSLLQDIQKYSSVGLFILLIVLFSVTWYSLNSVSNDERSISIDAIASYLSKTFERPLSQGDFLTIQTELDSRGIPAFIGSIEVQDLDGNVIAELNNKLQKCSIQKTKTFEINGEKRNSLAGVSVKYGRLLLNINECDAQNRKLKLFITILSLMGIMFFLMNFMLKKVIEKSLLNLNRIVEKASDNEEMINDKELLNNCPVEIYPLIKKMNVAIENSAKVAIAEKVAHDIISPSISMGNLISMIRSDLGEENYLALNKNLTRITDIANNLRTTRGSKRNEKETVVYIDYLVQNILSEKRNQYLGHTVEIYLDSKSDSGVFASFDEHLLGRILSNLVNNSIEALPSESGKICVEVKAKDDVCYISVEDDGKGIPSDIREMIFNKSFSTKGSSGIGLSSAREYLTNKNGDIFLGECREGFSTNITVKIPIASSPSWFVDNQNLKQFDEIIVLDDEPYSYEVVSKLINSKIPVRHFRNPKVYFKNAMNLDKKFFIVDYHYQNSEFNGVDVIKENNLKNQSILVTSQADSSKVKKECTKENIKLLSKTLLGKFKFNFDESKKKLVVLDDDLLMHTSWRMYFKKQSFQEFSIYKTSQELLASVNELSKESIFILDYQLDKDSSMNGADVGKRLKDMGFTNVYISSGYGYKKEFSEFKGVIPKLSYQNDESQDIILKLISGFIT